MNNSIREMVMELGMLGYSNKKIADTINQNTNSTWEVTEKDVQAIIISFGGVSNWREGNQKGSWLLNRAKDLGRFTGRVAASELQMQGGFINYWLADQIRKRTGNMTRDDIRTINQKYRHPAGAGGGAAVDNKALVDAIATAAGNVVAAVDKLEKNFDVVMKKTTQSMDSSTTKIVQEIEKIIQRLGEDRYYENEANIERTRADSSGSGISKTVVGGIAGAVLGAASVIGGNEIMKMLKKDDPEVDADIDPGIDYETTQSISRDPPIPTPRPEYPPVIPVPTPRPETVHDRIDALKEKKTVFDTENEPKMVPSEILYEAEKIIFSARELILPIETAGGIGGSSASGGGMIDIGNGISIDPTTGRISRGGSSSGERSSGGSGDLGPRAGRTRAPTPTSGSRRETMRGVYKAFRNAGYSHEGALSLAAEAGRENSFNPELIYGSHDDPHNGARNTGIFSYQKDRNDAFQEWMKDFIDPETGQLKRGQETLDHMAKFIANEFKERGEGDIDDMLRAENVDPEKAARELGKRHIRWRYDDPDYRHHHDHRRQHHANVAAEAEKMKAEEAAAREKVIPKNLLDNEDKRTHGEKNVKPPQMLGPPAHLAERVRPPRPPEMFGPPAPPTDGALINETSSRIDKFGRVTPEGRDWMGEGKRPKLTREEMLKDDFGDSDEEMETEPLPTSKKDHVGDYPGVKGSSHPGLGQ